MRKRQAKHFDFSEQSSQWIRWQIPQSKAKSDEQEKPYWRRYYLEFHSALLDELGRREQREARRDDCL
jgi:hypothetical protein